MANFFEDESYQDRLTKLLIWNKPALKRCGHLLTADDFKPRSGMRWGRPRWIIVERTLSHFERHHEPIGKLIRAEILDYAKQVGMSAKQTQECEQYLEHLKKIPQPVVEAVIEKILRWKQELLQDEVLVELNTSQGSGELTPEKWASISQRVMSQVSTSFRPASMADLLQKEYPESKFLLNNKMPQGLTMLAGKSKEGKTWLLLALALSVVRNLPFLGSKVKTPGAVLFLALEDSERRVVERLRMLAPDATSEDLRNLHLMHNWPGIAGLHSLMKECAYKLVVIDPFAAMVKERRTNDIFRSDYSELQPLRRLSQEFGNTVLVNNHLRKAPGSDVRDLLQGTMGVSAAVDTLWVLRPAEGQGRKKLSIIGRDVEDTERILEFSTRGWKLILDGPEAQAAGPLQRKILAVLKKHKSMSRASIAKAIGTSESSTDVTLGKMFKSGLVLKPKEGEYAYPK